ncbi:MAG: hypothetical protein Ct9H90mP4_12330 [Gammaproteobacteria bacterium]|nr:MAG: hypothetical protein Ct9H90mP4_12330 [Gammaproteobacteria bacterium]
MAINGAIAGLVAITAAPDTPTGGLATFIGLIGGIIVYFSVITLDSKFKIDDPVGAISAMEQLEILGETWQHLYLVQVHLELKR